MRFDELVLKIPGDELHLRFHPQLTVLSGLGALERQALSDSVLGSLCGGDEATAMRYVDGTGRTVAVVGDDGLLAARYEDDGSPAPLPLGSLAANRDALRSLMIVHASDLGVRVQPARDDEPPELQEARVTLAEVTEALDEALGEEQQTTGLKAELAALDEQLRAAHDSIAQREYAQVLAQLERVRAEVAALQTGTAGVEADRRLIAEAGTARELAARWNDAARILAEVAAAFGVCERLDAPQRAEAAAIPAEPPAGLEPAIKAYGAAQDERDQLDHRLQVLAVAKLPAPSDLLVGELGLLEQTPLWDAAQRLRLANSEMDRVQVSLGGIGGEDSPEPAVIETIETTHRAVEDAEAAAESLRVPGVAATGLGLALVVVGTIGAPLFVPLGLLGAAAAGTATLLLPKRRIAAAAAIERRALAAVGATSYLGFHIRRVDATVDPSVREAVESAFTEHRAAHVAWADVVGHDVPVDRALALADEVREYHDALKNLGGAADEIEHLRDELAERAEPTLAAARTVLSELCAPYLLDAAALADSTGISAAVDRQIDLGLAARQQVDLEGAEADERKAGALLAELLGRLGFDEGALDARVGAFEWAVTRAAEREEARAQSRPRPEIDADLARLQAQANELRRPEWATVTAADAAAPDIQELERRREKVLVHLDEVRPEVDVEHLADRHAAIERRVAALEAKHGGSNINGDPGAVADIQQHLLGHLTQAAQAGPHGDAIPAVLDEVFLRVPADRKWDLLDLLFRLSERHQMIYLSDDPFVAAWARQHAAAGAITLLEPEPESV